MKRILVIDPEVGARESIRAILWGIYEVQTAENPGEALDYMGLSHFDLLMVDILMPAMQNSLFLREVHKISPEIPIIAVSAYFDQKHDHHDPNYPEKMGFICKPFDARELRNYVNQTLAASKTARHQASMQIEISKAKPASIIGESLAIRSGMDVARKASQTRYPILIFGEVGSGRELLARQIHSWSRRSDEPFIQVECNRVSPELFGRELFGETLGTLDWEVKSGAIDLAGGGTILLEEVQHIKLESMKEIRDAIEYHEFSRLGSPNDKIPHISRFFFSFGTNLVEGENVQWFFEEMTNRFSAHVINVPPLRNRVEDIPTLCAQYLSQFRLTLNAKTTSIEPAALQKLQKYPWPGNIRELRNVLERVLVLHGDKETLLESFLPSEINERPALSTGDMPLSLREATDTLHRQMIEGALSRSNGKIKGAARLLRLTPRILQHRMQKLKIDPKSFKPA